MRVLVLVVLFLGPSALWADEEKTPPLVFHGNQLIERADGTVLFFHRPQHVTAHELHNYVKNVLRLKGVSTHVLDRQGILVFEGDPDAVGVALDGTEYFDVPPPQVRVEVTIERVTRSHAEGVAEAKAGTASEIEAEAELLLTEGIAGTLRSSEQESMPVLQESRNADTILRTTSVRTSWEVKLLAEQIGADHVTLHVEPSMRGTREPTAMRTALPAPIQVENSANTTVSVKHGQSVVVARIETEGAFEHEGAASPTTRPRTGTRARSARAGATETEIVITISAHIVRPREDGDEDEEEDEHKKDDDDAKEGDDEPEEEDEEEDRDK